MAWQRIEATISFSMHKAGVSGYHPARSLVCNSMYVKSVSLYFLFFPYLVKSSAIPSWRVRKAAASVKFWVGVPVQIQFQQENSFDDRLLCRLFRAERLCPSSNTINQHGKHWRFQSVVHYLPTITRFQCTWRRGEVYFGLSKVASQMQFLLRVEPIYKQWHCLGIPMIKDVGQWHNR
jgi:hypothetical protein